ncbi:MAG: glycine--tRNA ligase subunit beta, partial [Wenzhouxiangella sp.]
MSERADLLMELGCEELPARLLAQQSRLLAEGLAQGLIDAGLIDNTQGVIALDTPRRLAVRITDVRTRQADRELERKGPAENVAFDSEGNPTRAAEGFARSVGKKVADLERIENDQGRWLYARVLEPGRSLSEILPEILDKTIRQMAGARSMRWSDREERFLRPVRWLVALHGAEVLDISMFGLQAGRTTQGHRIHAPGGHELASADQYEGVLEKAFVLADPARRRDRIREQVETLSASAGLAAGLSEDLVDENAGLTEWPVAVIGSFDADFLQVPDEALVSSMQQHQKCFPLRQADGALSNRFVAVANIESRDAAAMIAGFERVIRPRLADARFFWDQDRKTRLDQRRAQLDGILFQQKLGSVGDKVRRLETLAPALARELGADPEATARAARLCKCDLVTEMVGEFPELQGIMGRHYALVEGEPETVAQAIESHYRPRHAGDTLPGDKPGQALALADRLDTVVGIFAAGKKPSGGKDPFALRRAALGLIRILEQTESSLTLKHAIELAAKPLADQLEIDSQVLTEVEEFLMDRLRSHATEQGIDTSTVQAVAAGKTGSVADFMARARAVQAFTRDPRAESLISANKRTSNLLRQAGEITIAAVNPELLSEDAEKALFDSISKIESELTQHLDNTDYPAALAAMSRLKEPVDRFFDEVMVMCEDEAVRANRLALLAQLRGLIADIAD